MTELIALTDEELNQVGGGASEFDPTCPTVMVE